MTASDESLFRASASGDSAAFTELYERHARTIYNYLFRRLADRSDAEDLTAVVFLEAYRRRKDVVVLEGKLLPWLYGIATNVLRNRRRALWRHRDLMAQLGSETCARLRLTYLPGREAAEQMRTVLTRVATLPRKHRTSSRSASGLGSATRRLRRRSTCRWARSARAWRVLARR